MTPPNSYPWPFGEKFFPTQVSSKPGICPCNPRISEITRCFWSSVTPERQRNANICTHMKTIVTRPSDIFIADGAAYKSRSNYKRLCISRLNRGAVPLPPVSAVSGDQNCMSPFEFDPEESYLFAAADEDDTEELDDEDLEDDEDDLDEEDEDLDDIDEEGLDEEDEDLDDEDEDELGEDEEE